MTNRIAIIGAGPKAAAIAARTHVLRAEGYDAPEITVFERDRIGAAWAGGGGYSDGRPLLCTSPERDVGFPYSHNFGRAAAARMVQFSWQAYLIDRGPSGFSAWVTRGQRNPSHAEFAAYLDWALAKSCADIRLGSRVDRLSHDGASWAVHLADGTTASGYDGIVLTGSGPPLPPLPGADRRVFNAHDFWVRAHEAEFQLEEQGEDASVVIVGSGGAAASVAYRFLSLRHRIPVTIVGTQPVLFARTDTYFEMKLFGDDDAWRNLSDASKQVFLDRLGGGTVWSRVVDELAAVEDLQYVSGRVSSVELGDQEHKVILDGGILIPGTTIVDCRGFDRWWLASLFDAGPALTAIQGFRATRIAEVNDTMALQGDFPFPRLHVPSLASMIGPAADNLLALGWMADQVLRAYVEPRVAQRGSL